MSQRHATDDENSLSVRRLIVEAITTNLYFRGSIITIDADFFLVIVWISNIHGFVKRLAV